VRFADIGVGNQLTGCAWLGRSRANTSTAHFDVYKNIHHYLDFNGRLPVSVMYF
jgi:hypothetical protein